MRIISAVMVLMWVSLATAEIPKWYKRDIANIIHSAEGVIIYRVKSVSLQSRFGPYYSYKVATETVEELKGKAPKGKCYFIHAEGYLKSPPTEGETGIVILNTNSTGECGAIEPGLGAPATNEYVALFRTIIETGT